MMRWALKAVVTVFGVIGILILPASLQPFAFTIGCTLQGYLVVGAAVACVIVLSAGERLQEAFNVRVTPLVCASVFPILAVAGLTSLESSSLDRREDRLYASEVAISDYRFAQSTADRPDDPEKFSAVMSYLRAEQEARRLEVSAAQIREEDIPPQYRGHVSSYLMLALALLAAVGSALGFAKSNRNPRKDWGVSRAER